MKKTPVLMPALLLLTSTACNEYDFSADPDRVGDPYDEDGTLVDGDADVDADADSDADSDTDADGDADLDDAPPLGTTGLPWEPQDGPPPLLTEEDCLHGVLASYNGGNIMVGSWSSTQAAGEIVASAEGWYHAYSIYLAESGSSQWNESAYFRVSNGSWPSGRPYYRNCGDEWIVEDVDNYGAPAGSRLYVGTFWLDAGSNDLEMNHYCPLYRTGSCPGHHITDDPGSTCDSGNINSVHYDGYALCLIPATR